MMPGVRIPDSTYFDHAGMNQELPESFPSHQFAKRRRIVHHGLRHKQQWESDPTLAPQDEVVFQGQLMRAISVSLSAVGFDSVKPSALEAFRAEVDEFMLHFLSDVKTSMQICRRGRPIPQDFAHALAQSGFTSSDLEAQLQLPIPPSITQPPIPTPPPEDDAPPELEEILGEELSGVSEKTQRPYIPTHLPAFPSKHTWQSTPVFSARETDPRKIREKATKEGVMAEQALRKLMAGNKGAKRRASTTAQASSRKSQKMWEDAMNAAVVEDEPRTLGVSLDFDMGMDGAGDSRDDKKALATNSGLLVNYDRQYWRKGAQNGMPWS